ncbi:unnamed protein product [Gongylonema pulchrum]|uniref:SAYSvFN domain-containing protein n=1 Tax=Gongylonema pulchrum TaxID=637853 RepID=A0A183DS86_9BILA|nr:unnamed protein product [Gongylonema pulchrum]
MRSVEERLAQFRRNAGRPPPPDTRALGFEIWCGDWISVGALHSSSGNLHFIYARQKLETRGMNLARAQCSAARQAVDCLLEMAARCIEVLSAMDKDADSCPSVSPAEVDAPTGVVQVPIQASWPWSSMYERAPRLCLVSIALSWLLLQLYFSYIQFGLVFFVLSLFVCIFLNLGKRRAGELSAYSVFNPHCERLPGTLTAEQLERDLLLQQRP